MTAAVHSLALRSTIKSFVPTKTLSRVFIALFLHGPVSSSLKLSPSHTHTHTQTITVDLYFGMKGNNHLKQQHSSRTAVFPSLITLFSKSERVRAAGRGATQHAFEGAN